MLVVVLLAAACGDGSGGSDSDHNDQDVSFAKDMVPHHQQAVTMSDLATANTTNPQILGLADRIKASQTAEISVMQGWLAAGGEEATDNSGHDMTESMQGMVSDRDMGQLEATKGGDFDRRFLRHMTAHHEGALEMA